MKDRALWIILGGIALLAFLRKGTATLGPLVPVTPTGNASPNADTNTPYSVLPNGDNVTAEQFTAITALCQNAPLNSFGDQCRGITWDYVNGDANNKQDWRTAPGTVSIDVVQTATPPMTGFA